VQEVLYPGMRPQPQLPRAAAGAKYVAFLSGLAVGEAAGAPAQLSLLLEFLTGMLGSPPDQTTSSRVTNLCLIAVRKKSCHLAIFGRSS